MQPTDPLYDRSDEEIVDGIMEALLGHENSLARYESLTRTQSIYEELIKRIAAERARAVHDMHAAGLSYGQIAEVIGFTRARAQQLVERAGASARTAHNRQEPSSLDERKILRFLEGYTADWERPRAVKSSTIRMPATDPAPRSSHVSAEQIAGELFANAAFRALQLGTFLRIPDSRALNAIVNALTPPLYRADAELLTKALTMAAQMQQKDIRNNAVKAAVLVAVGGALIAAASGSTST